jgi:hypothetical protein
MARRRKKKTTRRRSKPMIKVLPLVEAYALMNIATQNLTGGSPLQTLLGDLNASAGTGYGGQLMGPQPGVITVKEMLTGTMNQATYGSSYSHPSGKPTTTMTISTSATSPLDALSQNFQNNFGNIVVGSVLTTAGFRIANKVLSKPKNKFNAMIRQMGLGSTIQL